jgi:hypothetical protein
VLEQGLDGLIVFSRFQFREGHISYLTNHYNTWPDPHSHHGFGMSALVMSFQGPGLLVCCPEMHREQKVFNLSQIRESPDLCDGLAASPWPTPSLSPKRGWKNLRGPPCACGDRPSGAGSENNSRILYSVAP